jgi:Flp pilus assembly protein TadB
VEEIDPHVEGEVMATTDSTTPERTLGQLVAQATEDVSSIVRSELDLAKAELKADALKAGTGAGMFGVAGLLALYALGLLFFAAVYGIVAAGLSPWLAFLIIGVVLLIICGFLALLGKAALSKVQGKPKRTIKNAQDTVTAVKSAS